MHLKNTSVGGYHPARSTRLPVATGFFLGSWPELGSRPGFFYGSRPIFKKREIHEKTRKPTQLDKIRKKFGSRPPGSRPKLGSRPGKFLGRDPRWRSWPEIFSGYDPDPIATPNTILYTFLFSSIIYVLTLDVMSSFNFDSKFTLSHVRSLENERRNSSDSKLIK